MRLLFLSNFYPPASRGGYEEWCREAAEGLRAAGHEVQVLTSDFGAADLSEPDPTWVHRSLHLEMEFTTLRNAFQFFTGRGKREQENLTCLRELVESFKPEAAVVWGMWNLPRSVPALIEELLPGRVVYYMGDYWPSLPSQFNDYWEAPARTLLSNVPKALLRPVAQNILARDELPRLRLEHVLFPSKFMQREFERLGFTPRCTEVVYGAIETSPYLQLAAPRVSKDYISLLCVGRLVPQKGVHTAIEALEYLVRTLGIYNVKLTIVGSGEAEYTDRLHQMIQDENIAALVNFLPAQPKEALPGLYQQSDIFIFPSIWAEPFGRVIVEAMASGLPVVGTRVGGAVELLIENETALTFDPDDVVGLAQQLKCLIESPALRARLGSRGREAAVNRFDIQRMTAGIEAHVKKLVN